MAINDKDFYASHGISFDIEEMQIEYTKRVIKQAKIEALTELQTEIEEQSLTHSEDNILSEWGLGYNHSVERCGEIIQQKINTLKENINDTNTD